MGKCQLYILYVRITCAELVWFVFKEKFDERYKYTLYAKCESFDATFKNYCITIAYMSLFVTFLNYNFM